MSASSPVIHTCTNYNRKNVLKQPLAYASPVCIITHIAIIPERNLQCWAENVSCHPDSSLFITLCHVHFQHRNMLWLIIPVLYINYGVSYR
jgi:hypothetical protein